jgi:hypothetical protein
MFTPARMAALLLVLALAGCSTQINPSAPAAANGGGSGSSSAAAYVYVDAPSGGSEQTLGYYAASDGSLTSMPGSPFSLAAFPTVNAGAVLFGLGGGNIDSYQVQPGGFLTPESSLAINLQTTPNGMPEAAGLMIDPMYNNLYTFDYTPPDGLGPEFSSFGFDSGTGQVTQVGANVAGGNFLAVDSKGRYAVGSYCNARGGTFISEYQRGSDGALTFLGYAPFPAAGPYQPWCPGGTAADASGHLLVEVTPLQYAGATPGPPQLAIYTVDNSGNFTTASTSQNMTSNDVGQASYQFSPDYRYLAALGDFGIEVFTWDSAKLTLAPVGTLPSGYSCWQNSAGSGCGGPSFGNVAWDQNDHLYTILNNQLYVYAATPAALMPAPGSPMSIPSSLWVTVVPQSQQ